MNIKIGKPIKAPVNPKNKYRVYVKTMEGDADEYHYFTVDFTENKIENAIKAIDEIEGVELYDNPEDTYPEFDKYFGFDSISQNDGGILDSLDGYSVTYFDENGIEREVLKDGKSLSDCLEYNKAH